MSISSIGASIASLTQAKPQSAAQAPANQTQQPRPHHHHGGGRAPATNSAGSTTSASTAGTKLNLLV